MDEGRHQITNFEWDAAQSEGIYTIEGPGAVLYQLSVRPEGRNRVVLVLWEGDRYDADNYMVADSDPLRLAYEDEREAFYQSAVGVFGEIPSLREVFAFVARTHDKRVMEEKGKKFREQVEEQPEYRAIPDTDYFATPQGFAVEVQQHGTPELVFLSNFTARIREDVTEEDGSGEITRVYKVEARISDRIKTFEVPAAQFGSLYWVSQQLGALTIIEPPTWRNKSHIARAIQGDSTDLVESRGFAHTGWLEADGRWVYLHAGGAITGFDAEPFEGRVGLRGKLAHRVLPEPVNNEELRAAVRAPFKLWDLTLDRIAIPLDLATKRAVLGDVDFSIHVSGETGEGKTAHGRILLGYYGPGMGPKDEMAFDSTAYALEEYSFLLKDQLSLLDDYRPYAPGHQEAMARVTRAAANNSGRARMSGSGAAKWDRPPRGLTISTGEDMPRGQSLVARVLIVSVPKGSGIIPNPELRPTEDVEVQLALVNDCQDEAKNGVYARAMSGFLAWLAPQFSQIRHDFESEHRRLRREVRARHPRTQGIYADLVLTLRLWLRFSLSIGAIDRAEHDEYLERAMRALRMAIAAHDKAQEASDPVERFRDLLAQAVASGKAHLTDPASDSSYEPRGIKIGWTLDDGVYIYPEVALRVARELSQQSENPLTISMQAMNKLLQNQGLLLSTNLNTARKRLTVRKMVGGESGTFLHLRKTFLTLGE